MNPCEPLDAELERLMRLAAPGAPRGGTLSFAPTPGAHLAGAWQRWAADVFAPRLVPALLAVLAAAGADHAREVLRTDARLLAELPVVASAPLVVAGRGALAGLDGLRGSRPVARLRAAAGEGRSPGLFPVVFALRAALHAAPPRLVLLAYAGLEWRAAAAARADWAAWAAPALGRALEAVRPLATAPAMQGPTLTGGEMPGTRPFRPASLSTPRNVIPFR